MNTTQRKPRSLPKMVRCRNLRLAGLAETNRLRDLFTAQMVEPTNYGHLAVVR